MLAEPQLSPPNANRQSPSEIATRVLKPEVQQLFKAEVRKPGAWSEEQPYLKDKLGPLGPILPLHATPEARRAKYLVRADILLMAEGFIPPNTPEFALAQRTMAEMVISQRPDVVLWTLKSFYPTEKTFQAMIKGAELAVALQGGLQLPTDYRQKVDILAQFDEFEAVGDPNQPTRKQTPLIPIVAEVAKIVREQTPLVQAPVQEKAVKLPTAKPNASAREVLGTILNSDILSEEQKIASKKAYDAVVERALGKVPTEAYTLKELPGQKTPIEFSEDSQKDTVAHAENPGWGRNRQFGLISLTDAYFGGALELFSEPMNQIAAKQLEPLPYGFLHERAAGILVLAENKSQREQVGDLLRERLQKILTSECTFGYEFTDHTAMYPSRKTAQRMISDLASLSDNQKFQESPSRGLYINLPNIRGKMDEVREVLQSLKKTDGDYFSMLEKQLDVFVNGQFLKDVDGYQTRIGADYQKNYRNQILAGITGETIDTYILYPGVEDFQKKLNTAIKHAPEGWYSSSDRATYMARISDALKNPSAIFEEKDMQEDLERARKVMEGVSPVYNLDSWRNVTIISRKANKDDRSIGEDVIASAATNKKEFDCLGNVLKSMAFMYDMAELHSAIPEDRRPQTPLWEPQSQGISLKGATNPYAVLRMVMAGGKPLSDFTEEDQWTDPLRNRGDEWPPKQPDHVERDFKRHKADLVKAFKNITPIDIEVTAQKPIALIVGNNGSGKTFAMETAIQSMGMAERTGLQSFSKKQRKVHTPVVRAMINASRHQEAVSSFQNEVDLMKNVIEDIKARNPDSAAVWAIDEIGKGTDSRDALSLLFGTIEWARRNNVHFVVSTHYGRQFMELANMLGLAESVQIYNPNAETHELIPNTEVTASHGIEVMEKMGRKNDIPPELLDALAENARRIRAVHDNRDLAQLAPIESAGGPVKNVPFAHEEDLADIGVSTTNTEIGGSGNFAISALSNTQWPIPETMYGETVKRSSYCSSHDDEFVHSAAETVRSRWSTAFQKEFANSSLSHHDLAARKDRIREMVDFTSTNLEAFSGASAQMLSVATGLNSYKDRKIRPNDLKTIHDQLSRFHTKEDPLKEGYGFGMSDRGIARDFHLFEVMSTSSRIEEYKKNAQELANYLTQEGSSDNLKMIGKRIALSARIGSHLIEKAQIPSGEVNLRYNTAIVNHLLARVRHTIVPSSSYSTDYFKAYIPQMQELFGTQFQKSADIFTYIAEKSRNGDLSTLVTLNEWILKQEIPRYTSYSGPIPALKTSLSFLSEINSGMVTRLSKSKEALSAAQSLVGDTTATPEVIAQKMHEAFLKGDCTLLDQLLSIPKIESGLSYSSSDDALKLLKKFSGSLSADRWIRWQDSLSEMKSTKSPTKPDYYASLHLNPEASVEEIRKALETAKSENTLQKLELENAEKTLLSDERLAYDLALAEKALSEAQFLFTISGAIQRNGMCIPEHSEDGSMDVVKGINLQLANSMGSHYIPQSLHVASGTNTVVIGGMNGGGKSQTLIGLADIMAWDHYIGYVPAEKATLPKADFIVSAINAGESIVGMSSFQNEITRYLKVLDRYVEAGCPKNGMVFLDEPLAGTSSEDQAGILISIVDFLQSRGVKVIMTNHNHAFFDVIKRTTGSDGKAINFLPVAFGAEGASRYQLEYFSQEDTAKIKSRGIDVAEERGVDPAVIQVARQVRKLIDQIEEVKGNAKS